MINVALGTYYQKLAALARNPANEKKDEDYELEVIHEEEVKYHDLEEDDEINSNYLIEAKRNQSNFVTQQFSKEDIHKAQTSRTAMGIEPQNFKTDELVTSSVTSKIFGMILLKPCFRKT